MIGRSELSYPDNFHDDILAEVVDNHLILGWSDWQGYDQSYCYVSVEFYGG